MNSLTTAPLLASQAPTCDKQDELGAWHSAGPQVYCPQTVTEASLLREALTLQADIVTGVMDLITRHYEGTSNEETVLAIAALLSSPKMTTATRQMHAALTAGKI